MANHASSSIGIIASAVLVVSAPEVCRAQQGNPTIEQILSVWKNRQDKVVTARFELNGQETLHKGLTTFMANPYREKHGLPLEHEPNPPRDYLVEQTSSVSLDGGKLRYSYDHQQWDPIGKRLYPEHYIDVFDGRLFKFLQSPASGDTDYPQAAVRQVETSQSGLQYPILPLIFTFRGSHLQFFHDLDKFQITGRSVDLEGHRCLELMKKVAPTNPDDSREVLYLDEKRDYIVVKQMILHNGQPDWQLSVNYNSDADIGWIPRSWEYIIRAGKEHQFLQSGRSKVIHYEINPKMESGEFDIQFPPKTRVHDESSGTYVEYVIGQDGEKGRAIPAALNPTYEVLQKDGTRNNRRLVLVVCASIFLLAAIGGVWLRLRRVRGYS